MRVYFTVKKEDDFHKTSILSRRKHLIVDEVVLVHRWEDMILA